MGKFKVGDAVQLAHKPIHEYSPLVINDTFRLYLEGKRLVVEDDSDEEGDYLLVDGHGGLLFLTENDIEAWDDESGDYHLMDGAGKTLWLNDGDIEVCDEV